MSYTNPYDDSDKHTDNDMDTDRIRGTKMEDAAGSAGTRSGVAREKGMRAPPGPASSKGKRATRSRSNSASSTGSVSDTLKGARRSRRRAEFDANRQTVTETDSEGSTVVMISEDTGDEEQFYSPTESREPSLKRKMEDGGETLEGTQSKQGRPRTTGLYVGRAKAQEEYNEKMREKIELEREKTLREMGAGKIFSKIEKDLETAIEQLEMAPTADIASRGREAMLEVLRVSKISRNLQGGCKKSLNQAAVIGAASTEILRTRADSSEPDTEAYRQLREIRKELDNVKREAQAVRVEAERAKQETEKLREELDAANALLKKGSRRRRVMVDDEEPPPTSPARDRVNGAVEREGTATTQEEGDTPMSMEVDAEPPQYDDERRKAEILPPPGEWPPWVRPPIKGKAKVMEDRILSQPLIKMVDKKVTPVTHARVERAEKKEKQGGAQSLMDQLTPLLEKWLRENLLSLGLQGHTEKGSNENSGPTAKRNKPKDTGVKKGGEPQTKTSNKQLRSAAAEKKEGSAALPSSKGVQRDTSNRAQTAQPPRETWVEVVGRKAKKPLRTVTQAPVGQGKKEGPQTKGQDTKRNGQAITKTKLKRRPPRTAAVTLTCPPGGYADAMRIAREKINLQELGIQALRPKKAATGALVLEVSGPNGAERAEALKEKMREALQDVEGTRVARPVKQAEVRVKDIIEPTSIEEIKEAFSRIGGCKVEDIRAGEIRPATNGLGTLWIRGPLTAVNRVVVTGKITLGLTTSRVEALEPRRQQCFKCLERGHVQAVCPSTVDRSRLCYRCGQEGHEARACSNPPRCIVCETAGRQAAHRMGGNGCKAPNKSAGLLRGAIPPVVGHAKKDGKTTATSGGPPQTGGTEPLEQRKRREGYRPAVRGGPTHTGCEGASVPVRPGQEEEPMDIETEGQPAPSRYQQGNSSSRESEGAGTPAKELRSPQ